MQLKNVCPSNLPTTTLSVGYLHDGFTVRETKILCHLDGVVSVATETCMFPILILGPGQKHDGVQSFHGGDVQNWVEKALCTVKVTLSNIMETTYSELGNIRKSGSQCGDAISKGRG